MWLGVIKSGFDSRRPDKKETMEYKKGVIILILVVVLVIWGTHYFSSNQGAENDQQPTKQEEEVAQTDTSALQLAKAYQATIDWEENLTYTLQAQERLITGKPTLFKGYVDDIFRQDEKVFVRIASSFASPINYILELECSQTIVDKLFTHKPSDNAFRKFFDDYAIVAIIKEVTRPTFTLEGSSLSDGDVSISIEPSNLFTAKGVCIDGVYLGEEKLF